MTTLQPSTASDEITIGPDTYRYLPLASILTADEIAAAPYAVRILIENVARRAPASLDAVLARFRGQIAECELPFHPNRIMLHDTTCLPALADFAAMRDSVAELGGDPTLLQPSIPVDLTVDHSVIAEEYGRPDALEANMAHDFRRNSERYRFIKWAERSIDNFGVIPPGTGIIHQVNMESLATAVWVDHATTPPTVHPDVLVATDSHTPMINSIGIVGWGVGGLQGQAAMLGEPVTIQYPTVVGVELTGALRSGVTGTDLALTLTELLRAHGVVDKFVEFHGAGALALGWADRAAVSNMAPEYGATCALFPADEQALRFLALSGRSPEHCELVRHYLDHQQLLRHPDSPTPVYDEHVALDLAEVVPSLAGPRMPHERVALPEVPRSFRAAAPVPAAARGIDPVFGERVPAGPIAVAAITSCTNTANPTLMVQAGLLARRAVAAGLASKPWVKTSLSPGSQVVTGYLAETGLLAALESLGFYTVGFGCMTCIGNSGPLHPRMEELVDEGVVPTAVLSGNRNFPGRVNPRLELGYLGSPPLVVAYALAGTILHDFENDPLGRAADGSPIHLRDLWPSDAEVAEVVARSVRPEQFRANTAAIRTGTTAWQELTGPGGTRFDWDLGSTYIRRPSYLTGLDVEAPTDLSLAGARPFLVLGDNVTTDHISPAGAIPHDSAAAEYLRGFGVRPRDFNQYSTRRSNHEVMLRGAFTNAAVVNRLLEPGTGGTGGWAHTADRSEVLPVYDAAASYRAAGLPLVVFAGRNYGAGSSRDWAAKSQALLGVRAVVAESFERIHRSNLIGMGVLPIQFAAGDSVTDHRFDGTESLTFDGLDRLEVGVNTLTMRVTRPDGSGAEVPVTLRLDTRNEIDYLRHNGTLPYVVRKTLAAGGSVLR
ncbi:aconitate hydratase AcnA [Nocardia testacea]|uniref:Aconitate hydratase n=1 Tax=Nocardia testacea TaxID=248551 RepID=A0ABW7VV78_9NOCA